MKILGISGSLRTNSYNTWLLNNVISVLPEGVRLEIHAIDNMALFNEDLEKNKPDGVLSFIDAVETADALIIATPEYNHSIPGGLKNAIDWASRPGFQSPLKDKPCAIVSASQSLVGGARAQADLKNVLASTISRVYPSVEYLLDNAQKKFDAKGNLTDETAKRRLSRYVTGFIDWTNLYT